MRSARPPAGAPRPAGPLATLRAPLADLPAGALVVICCPSGPDLAGLIGTCLDRALVAVPLAPRTSDGRLAEIAALTGAALVLDGRDGAARVLAPRGDGSRDQAGAAGLAFVIFTSGSTGRPKGVMLGRDAVAGNAARTASLLGLRPDRPHATCLPLHHVNALVMSLVGTRLRRAPLIICPRFEPEDYFRRIAAAGARTASVVPALLERIVETRPPWPESLEYLVTAAAPVSSELAGLFYRCYGPRLRQGYGLSEAVNMSFMMPSLGRGEFREQYLRHRPPVGLALPGTELSLDDGEVTIRSPDLMRGYWADPAGTSAVIGPDGWLRTGDLGYLRDGLLVLRGRRAEVINRGGEKHYPAEIERQWRDAGLTGSFAAVPVEVNGLGQEPGLVLGGGPVSAARLLHRSGALAPIAARAGGLLVTATGKPRRGAMGGRLTGRRDSADRYRDLLGYARAAAAAIVTSEHRPGTALAGQLRAHAAALAAAALPAGQPGPGRAGSGQRSAAHDALDALVGQWPEVAGGTADGAAVMRCHPGLWQRLMTEWPMGSYAELMYAVLRANGWLGGRVLEVGSGVGNTTSLIAPLASDLTWSDRSCELVRRGSWPGRGMVLDFDRDPPPGLDGFTAIVATNALHCAADKLRSLRALRSMLAAGGALVLAEGSSPTTPDGTPWALDFLFCAFDGWWDRSGFLTRWEWLALLEQAGLSELGYSVLRAGRYDLGGVVWGIRRDG